MIPGTLQATLLLAAAAFACWGSWACAFKAAGPKWRFEHFYFDFAFGALVLTLVMGFTLGSAGEGLTFADAFLLTGRKQWAMAVAAGAIFNLGNMLLLAAVEIAGMAIAFPIAMATALAIYSARQAFLNHDGDLPMLLAGIALLLVSAALVAIAASRSVEDLSANEPGNRKSYQRRSAGKPTALAVAGGVFLALCLWPLTQAQIGMGELNMGPYALAVLFCVGMLLTTFVYNLYFINLPVHGEPAGFGAYFQEGIGVHLLGIFGGAIFAAGLLTNFIALEGEGAAAIPSGLGTIVVPASAILAGLWGLLVWREFRGASGRAMTMIVAGLLCFAAGLAAIALRPPPA
jgi:glucose uptake protein